MEYVIWGIPPGETDEALLHTTAATRDEAKRVKAVLESKHGCTAVRIQELDLFRNDVLRQFAKSVRV